MDNRTFYDRQGNKILLPSGVIPKDRLSIYGIIPHPADKTSILIVNPTGYANKWMLPGGGLEQGENDLSALRREVFEETGLLIDKAHPTPFYQTTSQFYDNRKQIFYFSHNSFFFAEIFSADDLRKEADEEIQDAFFAPITHLHSLSWIRHMTPFVNHLLQSTVGL